MREVTGSNPVSPIYIIIWMEDKNRYYRLMWLGQGIKNGFKIYAANYKSFLFATLCSYLGFCLIAYYLLYVFQKTGTVKNPINVFDAFCDLALYFYFLISPFIIRITISYSQGGAPNTLNVPFKKDEAVKILATTLLYTVMVIFSISSYTVGIYIIPILGPFGFIIYVIAGLIFLIFAVQTPLIMVVSTQEKFYFLKAFKRSLELVEDRKTAIISICIASFLVFNTLTYVFSSIIEKICMNFLVNLTDNQKVFLANKMYHIAELFLGAVLSPFFFIYLTLYYFQIIIARKNYYY